MELHIASDAEAAAREAAHVVARKVWPAVRRRGRFTVALSGGSTPGLMLQALAAEPDVPWGTVHLYQVDERMVGVTHPERNAAQLGVVPVPTANRHLMEVEWGDRRLAIASYTAALPEQLDLVHLGLGDDGHTASWPPGSPVVDSKVTVATVENFNGRDRMTVTPLVVNAARSRLILATGEAKAKVVARWLAGDDSMPANRVKRSNTIMIIDQAAAAELG